jgi:hypothetical protein
MERSIRSTMMSDSEMMSAAKLWEHENGFHSKPQDATKLFSK